MIQKQFRWSALFLFFFLAPITAQVNEDPSSPVTVTFVGDIMLDNGPGHIITNHGDPFANVAPILLHSDISVGNLECAITRAGHAQDKTYTFKGPAASLPLLKKYFTTVSLANNHSGDWGTRGFADELAWLKEQGIAWFGGGINKREARRPFVIDVHGQRIALLGYNNYPPKSFAATGHKPGTAWLIEQEIIADILTTRRETKADWIFLYLHWGEELEDNPTQEQIQLAHRLIDAGADGIIGSHPHVTQTIESYRGKPIIYSLGNFVFDYFPGDPPLWTSYMLQLKLTRGRPPQVSTIPLELDPAGIPHLVTKSTAF